MKAIFKKMAVVAISLTLIVLMALSVMPMVFADEEAPKAEPAFELQKDYEGELTENLSKMNVSLSGRVTLKLTYVITEKHGYIEITVPDANRNPVKRTIELTDADYDAGKIEISVSLAAAQQTELIKFQWFGKNGEAGKWRKYSVKYYAGKIMDMASGEIAAPEGVSDETVAKMDQTVKSMLNYGAMAQKVTGYYTENLANKDLYAEENNPVNNMTVDHLYDAVRNDIAEDKKDIFKGVNVFLDTDVRIRIYVDVEQGTMAKVDGRDVKVSKDEDGSYIGIYNIPANMFDHAFEIEVGGKTINYSILGWCISTLESYKTDADVKNIARALYTYYTFTRQYATREDEKPYTPGPKVKDEDGNPIIDQSATCNHERYSLSADKTVVVCADCGEDISKTTRVSLDPEAPQFIIDENGTDVTFLLNVVGAVDLSALCVTPVADGLVLTNPRLTFIEPHKENLDGAAALNIVLDAAAPITEGCTLVKVTYNVKATNGIGSYKINLTVNEAVDSESNKVEDKIVPVATILEAVAPECQHEKNTFDTTEMGHRWYCDDCQQVGEWEKHDTTDVPWTHVLADEGGKVTGELYEEKLCTVCHNAAETRKLYYYNGIDAIRVNGTVVNPYKSNVGQSVGIKDAPASGYNTFVVSPENFIDVNKDPLTFHDNDSFKTGGWFAVNGGVERYVIRINDGAWQNLTGGYGTVAADSGIGKAIVANANITDKDGAFKNANYQGLLAFSDFSAYANQTIKITLGAVPAANPGADENPNVLITAVIENLFVECTHLGQNVASAEATDVPTIFNATCVCGESYVTTDVNDEGLKMFNADEILTRTTGHNTAYSVTKMTEGDLDFVRFELLADKTTGSEYLWYFADNDKATAPKLTYGISDTFMIVYRANEKYPNSLMLFANQTTYKNTSRSISDDGEWHVAMFDLSSVCDETLGYIKAMRFDIFDDYNIAAGATFDIAYMGFFKDANHAMDNYKTAIDKYEFDKANFRVSMDAFKVDGTGYVASSNPKPDNMNVISIGDGEWKAIEIDFAGTTIKTIDSSLNFCGWIVTPSGAKSISYRIIDKDGNASELRHYLTPSVITADNGIAGATTGYMYGDGRLNGSAFQATTKAFDLSGYAGETVTVEVILINNWGQTATVMKLYNVSVPACSNHELHVVEAKDPTCTTPGHESYKTCDSCGMICDLNDVELDAIPEIAINPAAHVVVDKALVAPTNTADGCAAHKACSECGKIWSAAGEELDAVPTIAKIVPTTNKYWGYEDFKGWKLSAAVDTKPSADRSYVRFDRNAECSDVNAVFLTDNNAVTGQYLVFKYRTTSETYVQVWANTLANGHDGGNAKATVSTIADGEWHIAVVDLSTLLPSYVKAVDGKYTVQWARIDMLDPIRAAGTYFDFGFIALTDDISKVESVLLEGDKSYCSHKIECTWNTDIDLYESVCALCGKYETSDMLYKTEGITGGNVGSGGNFLSSEVVTEGGETFTRYTAVCSPEVKDKNGNVTSNYSNKVGDPVSSKVDTYFYPIKNNTNVTGKYMIIKYRVVNNGTNLSTGATFASSAASGQTGAAGNNGDNSMYVAPNSWYADGEWHTIMIQPTDNNKTFVANADGTYTWAYLRIRVNNLAVGGYIDIAEIAFADNAEAADLYACKNDAKPVFVVNIDADNALIDGQKFLSKAAQKASTVVFDMSQYAALTTPTSLRLGGWVCTRGGVSNYQIRVTKIDGVEVENPELKSFFKPSAYRNDIYTAYGKAQGYTSECANGAGMNLSTVNLTAWAGHTVEFEIVVTTNAGQQFVAVRCENVVVPKVAE